MNFVIFCAQGQMSIDSAVMPIDTSSVASGTAYVVFLGDNGQTEPTGLPIRTSITDPSPYQTCVNNWLTAAAAASPALTLAQAQTIKSNLVNTIFKSYERASISYLSYNWDCSPDAIAAMTAMAATLGNGAIALAMQAVYNVGKSVDGSVSAGLFNASGAGWPANSSSNTYVANVSGVQWTPLGQSTPVSLTMAQFMGLLGAIVARRALLAVNQQALLASIAAAATIAAVIAIDITSGWPAGTSTVVANPTPGGSTTGFGNLCCDITASALPNGVQLSSIGLYNTAGIVNVQLAIVQLVSSTSMNILAVMPVQHPSGGWVDFPINYQVPGSGSFYVAVMSFVGNINYNSSRTLFKLTSTTVAVGNSQAATESTNTNVPATRATYMS